MLVIRNGVSDARRRAERKLLNTDELQTLGITGALTGEAWVKECLKCGNLQASPCQKNRSEFFTFTRRQTAKVCLEEYVMMNTYKTAKWLEYFSRLLRQPGFKLSLPRRML